MNLEDTVGWKFSAPLTETSKIECPNCHQFSSLTYWSLSSNYCETCGDHDMMVCPNDNCYAGYDFIHDGDIVFNVEAEGSK